MRDLTPFSMFLAFLMLLMLLLLATPAMATEYWFSDCLGDGSGSSNLGTEDDPWCHEQDDRPAIEWLWDGLGTEAVAGDTIWLCAGACNGTGSGTYYYKGNASGDLKAGTTAICDTGTGFCSEPGYKSGVACTADADCECYDQGGGSDCTGFLYAIDPKAEDVCTGSGTPWACCDGLKSGTCDGDSGNPIIVSVWAEGGNCETVTLSGDTDADNTLDATDVNVMVTNRGQEAALNGGLGAQYIEWHGSPAGCGGAGNAIDGTLAPYLRIEKTRASVFDLQAHSSGQGGFGSLRGPNGWVIDGVKFGKTGRQFMWDGDDLFSCTRGGTVDNTCSCENAQFNGQPGMGVFMRYLPDNSTFTLKNSVIHDLCGFGLRFNEMNYNDPTTILIDNNEFYNMASVDNNFNISDYTFSNNYAHDAHGISVEDRTHDVTIEDNVIACLGDYDIHQNRRCNPLIQVGRGDLSADVVGHSWDIVIQRNIVYGVQYEDSRLVDGWALRGISYDAFCTTDITDTTSPTADNACPTRCDEQDPTCHIIQNNIVWYIGNEGDDSPDERGAILVTNLLSPLLIRNNTVFASATDGLHIHVDADITADPDTVTGHRIESNLFIDAVAGNELEITAEASNGLIMKNNNIHDFGRGGTEARIDYGAGFQSYQCADIDGQMETDINGDGGTASGNVCQSVTFANTTGWNGPPTHAQVKTWDLHLDESDTGARDQGLVGPTDDVDGDTRDGTPDIGADEFTPSGESLKGGAMTGGAITRMLKKLSDWSCRTGIGACLEKP